MFLENKKTMTMTKIPSRKPSGTCGHGPLINIFQFGLRLRSKTRCFKTRVLGRRLPNGKPQERLRFRALRSKNASVQKTHCDQFLRFKDFPRGQGLRLGPLRSKNAAFCFCVLKPTKNVIDACKTAQRATTNHSKQPSGLYSGGEKNQ